MSITAASIFTSEATSSGLPEELEDLFIEGYCDAAPADYDAATDCEGPQPWCCPWYASDREGWQTELLAKLGQTDGDIREAAKLFALEDYDELAEILAEETAYRASEEEGDDE